MHTHRTSPVLLLTGLCLTSIITGSAAQTALQFTQEVYSTAVHETFDDEGFDRPADGFIQVECTYANTTLPAADIEYSIVSSSPGPFSLNQTDGRLSVTADLDYETVQFYSFEVICFNTSDSQINDTADVEITVDPVNECRPNLASRSGTVLLNEVTPVGYLIASPTAAAIRFFRIRFDVSDCDAQPDNNIMYTFSEASDQDMRFFNLDLLSGNLTLKEALDVDTITGLTDRISLRLTICDVFPALDTCPNFEVVIIVAAVNDNNPQFSQLVYEVTFPESTPVGTTLLEAQCTDADKGIGAFELIRFQDTVDCNCLEMLELDSTEGIIALSQPLDYETVQQYDFGLICEDNRGAIAAASVVINVDPVNECRPNLASRSGTVLLNEETPVGYLIASPTATAIQFFRIRFDVSDCDAQPDNNITYTFSDASDQDMRFFNLDLLSGNLTLKEELDVDTITGLTDRISLRLTICDVFPALDTCPNFEVIILVAATNDNNPQFSQPIYEVSFPESTPVGTTLLEAQCTDNDKGVGAFELIRLQDTVDCNCLEMWELNGTEGIITLSQPLAAQRYEFGLICEDNGGTIAAASVVINVDSVNDNGLLSIPEIIIVAVSALIFTMILCVLFWCCFYCCVKWSRKHRKHVDSEDDEETHVQTLPLRMLISQGPPFTVGQAPRWGYPNLDSYTPSELSEEHDLELSTSCTLLSLQRENPTMGPVLREVMDIFNDGDELLHDN